MQKLINCHVFHKTFAQFLSFVVLYFGFIKMHIKLGTWKVEIGMCKVKKKCFTKPK